VRYVLCLDGLEASLIDPEVFPNLALTHQGVHDLTPVIIGGLPYPVTPTAWTSFITGKPPEETGIDVPCYLRWSNPVLHKVNGRYVWGRRGRLLRKLGFTLRQWCKEDLKVEPPDATYVNLPVLCDYGGLDQHHMLEGDDWSGMEEKFRREEQDALGVDGDLVVAWCSRADIYGHWKPLGEMKADCYFRLDMLAKRIREKADWLLIASDHGTIDGDHTSYGFWSCTHTPPKPNMGVLDFHDWIFQK